MGYKIQLQWRKGERMTEEEMDQLEDLQELVGPTELGRPLAAKLFTVVMIVGCLVFFTYTRWQWILTNVFSLAPPPMYEILDDHGCTSLGQQVINDGNTTLNGYTYVCKDQLNGRAWTGNLEGK